MADLREPRRDPLRDPPGDPTELLADLADLVLNVAREVRFRDHDRSDAITLTASEGNVMRFVHHHPGATPSEVARATGLQRSNLSTVLRVLEERDLVHRIGDAHDRRGVVLHPTPAAEANLAILRSEWAERFAAALGDNATAGPGDLEACVTLLGRLEAGLVSGRQGLARKPAAARPPHPLQPHPLEEESPISDRAAADPHALPAPATRVDP